MVSFLPGLALMKTTVLESMRTTSYFRMDTLYIHNNVLYVCDTSIHSYARARTYIIDTLIVVVLLFVVNMNTLNTFRRVGPYTEAIARHRKAGYDAGENERRAAEMANRRQELGGLP